MTPSPTSEARILANRENAKKSTGPRTESGKAASRGNALKHGLTAKHLLSHDERGLHGEILTDLHRRFQPATQIERMVIARIAFHTVRLDALAAPLMSAFDQTFTAGGEEQRSTFQLLSRYETKLENCLLRDMALLHKLRELRPSPNAVPPDLSELETTSEEPENPVPAAPKPPETVPAAPVVAIDSKDCQTKPTPVEVPAPAPVPVARKTYSDRPKYFIG